MKPKQEDSIGADNWIMLVEHYLAAVDLLNKEIVDPKHRDNKLPGGNSSVGSERKLRGPMLYLFRHALELFLKSSDIVMSGEYRYIHDLQQLLADFEESRKKRSDDFHIEEGRLKALEDMVSRYVDWKDEVFNRQDVKNEKCRYPNEKSMESCYGADPEYLVKRTERIKADIISLMLLIGDLKDYKHKKTTREEKRILEHIEKNETATISDLLDVMNITRSMLERHLSDLVAPVSAITDAQITDTQRKTLSRLLSDLVALQEGEG